MKYTEHKEFVYNPELFKLKDTQIALRMQREHIKKSCGVPFPKFFEVDRSPGQYDPLWHMPVGDRAKFSRTLEMPAIQTFDKANYQLTKLGLTPVQRVRFTIANLTLQEFNYFPTRGDFVYRNGYRYTILNTVIDPTAYWGQTGVWLGLTLECVIAPFGDTLPNQDPKVAAPADISPNAGQSVEAKLPEPNI